MKTPVHSACHYRLNFRKLSFTIPLLLLGLTAKSALIQWKDGAADYNVPGNWVGGVVPGTNDLADNDHGSNNAVQINISDPDWTVDQILAGNGSGDGAFVQNGQTLTLLDSSYSVNLGVTPTNTGIYTLNGGNINYGSGNFSVGEIGTGILNINGGTIGGSGNFADNVGGAPVAVTATMDAGASRGGTTWFEQGFDTGDGSVGLPTHGSTFTSTAQANHSYTMPASYTTNDAVMIGSNEQTSATITLTSPAAYSALSFLGSAGNGPMTVSYSVHHADTTTETGSLNVLDWFNTNGTVAYGTGGRVNGDGTGLNDYGAGNFPCLLSMDITLTNTASPVTSVALSYVSSTTPDAHACIMALSGSTGGAFSPISITGFNEDMVVEAGAVTTVANTITDVVNQVSGAVTVTNGGQLFIGNIGTAIYNLSGGSVDVHNYIALGRSSGNGTLNITGGTFNQDGGGNLLVGTGFNNNGNPATGVLTQGAGIINCQGQFLCPENAPSTGTYTLHGGTNNCSNWFVVGRGGATGIMNMDGGVVNRLTGGQPAFVVGSQDGGNSTGTLNFSGGTINCASEFWIGNAGGGSTMGTVNINGTAVLNANDWFAVGRGGLGVLNMTNGSITKVGNGHFDISAGGNGSGSTGELNQYGGVITNTTSDFWVGDVGSGTWNMNGGAAYLGQINVGQSAVGTWNMNSGSVYLGQINICAGGSATGTLSVNGGLIQTIGIFSSTSGTTVSTLSLNGGTLQAVANNPSFISGLFQTTVGPGVTTIDSQNFSISIPQVLSDNGGGGLTKIGTGTLTLTGANTYSGPTVVNGGALDVGTSASGGGAYTVANNQTLGVTVQSANAQLNASAFSISGSSMATLNFDLGNFGNPTLAPLNVIGTWTASGNITINLADALPQIGQFPLIKYGTLSGSPSFTLGSVPTGVSATLVNDTTNSSIDVKITGVNQPRWDGQAGGNWDIGLTTNWVNIGTGQPTFYTEGSPTVFDDNAAGVTTVNLTTTVHPASVTVINSNLNYTFVGSGSISGAIGLTKEGSSTLTIDNNNSYTGPTVILGGTLSVSNLANGGSPSSIGASSASPANLVISSGATFSYVGAPVTVNRGYDATNGTIDAESTFTLTGLGDTLSGTLIKVGPGKMTYAGVGVNVLSPANVGGAYQVNNGTVVMDGSAGGQTNTVAGEIWVGGTPATGANLIVTNSTLSVGSWLGLGRGNGTIGNVSSLSAYNSALTFGNVSLGYANGIVGNLASQFLTLSNSTLIDHGDMNLAESGGSTATISLSGNSLLSSQNRCFLGGISDNSTASMTIGGTSQFVIVNGWFSIGNGNGSSGSVTVENNGSAFVSGDFNLTDTGTSSASVTVQDNGLASGNTFLVAKNGGTTGNVTLSGGTIVARGGDTWIGGSGNGTMNQTGGTLIGTNWISIGRNGGGTGVYNLSGGTLMKVNPNGTRLNVAENGTGTLNVSGTGTVIVGVGGFADLDICSGNGNGAINLNGGSITAGQITHLGGGTAAFNFNGGTLIASSSANANFMSGLTTATVMTNGAFMNSGGNIINIGQALLDGGGGGGLTKIGNGTLLLDGVNTYTGGTLVSAGALGGTGTIAGPVRVASGATLAPGGSSIGTLSINNSLTFSNGSTALFRISNDGPGTNSDLVSGLTGVSYAGSLVVTNSGTNSLVVGSVFQLVNSAAPGTGNFSSVTVLPAGSGTFNPNNGQLTITSISAITLNHPAVSGGNLIVTGTGSPGTGYTLLTSTNVALPLAQWTTNTTGTFSGAGTSSNAIPLDRTNRFFLLRQP